MSRTINPNIQYEKNGKPIVGGKVYYGVANQDPKTNLITIFSDSNLTVPITNPQLLDGQGRLSSAVYVGVNQYSFQVDDNLDNQQLSDPQLEPMNIVGLVTASIDLNGFKIVNAGDATANSEYATFGQNNELYPQILDTDASSTADSLIANMPVPMDSLGRKRIILRLDAALSANLTLTPTFKLNSFSAFTITRDNNDSLLVGDTGGGRYYLDLTFSPDDNRWHLSNPFNLRDNSVSTAKVLDNDITDAKLSDMPQSTIKGRESGAGTGDPIDLTPTQVRTIINVENGATADQSDAEIEAAYNSEVPAGTDSEISIGTESGIRRWSPQELNQGIDSIISAQSPNLSGPSWMYNRGNVTGTTNQGNANISPGVYYHGNFNLTGDLTLVGNNQLIIVVNGTFSGGGNIVATGRGGAGGAVNASGQGGENFIGGTGAGPFDGGNFSGRTFYRGPQGANADVSQLNGGELALRDNLVHGWSGSWRGGSGGAGSGPSGQTSAGGDGGGLVVILCTTLNFTGGILCNGGPTSVNDSGSGGGGGIVIAYNNLITNTGIRNVSGAVNGGGDKTNAGQNGWYETFQL